MVTAEDILKNKSSELYAVPVTATVREAAEAMSSHRIGAILVKDGERIAGIWTERDLLRNIVKPDFNPSTAKIADLMSSTLKVAPHTDSVLRLMDKFVGQRIRRILIEKDGKIIGLLTAGDVMRACLEEKDEELKSLNALVGWDYYENWKWETRDSKGNPA